MDSVSLSKARTTFRRENINHLAGKLKAQYGADHKNYILQGAIYDTDRWCVALKEPERNPNERKSVRALLKRKSTADMQMFSDDRSKYEMDVR